MIYDKDRQYLIQCQKTMTRQQFELEFKKVKANIPEQYRKITFNDLDFSSIQPAVKIIKKYVKNLNKNYNKGQGLYIVGLPGLGKTSLACIVLMEALKHNKTAYFTTLEKCIKMLVDSWEDDDIHDEFEYNILQSDFLVLDEVGNEYGTKLVTPSFTSIFRERGNKLLPTIITSNKTLKLIKKHYGDLLHSLLCWNMTEIICEGKDDYRVVVKEKLNE